MSRSLSLLSLLSLVIAVWAYSPALADGLFKGGLFDIDAVGDTKAAAADAQEEKEKQQAAQTALDLKRKAQYRFDSADQYLFLQMQKISEWLDNYVVMNHRFPEQVVGGQDAYNLTFGQGDELTFALQEMSLLIPNNPYGPGTIYAQPGTDVNPLLQVEDGQPAIQAPSDGMQTHNRIVVSYDGALNTADLNSLTEHPPDEWRGSPGTIGIVTDNLYHFIIWGAGRDGKPIRDPYTGNARLVIGNYVTWDQPPLQP